MAKILITHSILTKLMVTVAVFLAMMMDQNLVPMSLIA